MYMNVNNNKMEVYKITDSVQKLTQTCQYAKIGNAVDLRHPT